jgi:hypothetical protein
MKRISLLTILVFLIFTSCKKNTFNAVQRADIEDKALVKLGLFNAPTVALNLLAYDNGERISGALALPYPFPGGGFNTSGSSNGDYLALNPGSNKFEFYTTNPGTVNLITKFFETTQTFDANKKYTVYTTDTAANATAITAVDDAVAPDSGFSRIRFINLMPNAASVDFYKGTTLLKKDISYKTYTEFFDIAPGSDSFSVRIAGSAPGSALSALAYRVIAPTNKRIYSFLSRGYVGQTGNRAPNVSAIVNQ